MVEAQTVHLLLLLRLSASQIAREAILACQAGRAALHGADDF